MEDLPSPPTCCAGSDPDSSSSPARSDGARMPRPKRKRHVEFDESGEWTDIRRFDRMPVTTESASEIESVSGAPPGTYFISLARKRMLGMIDLHDRWLKKIKNSKSDYAAIQADLKGFYRDMLVQFDRRYARHIAHPMFETMGMTRKRGPNVSS